MKSKISIFIIAGIALALASFVILKPEAKVKTNTAEITAAEQSVAFKPEMAEDAGQWD